MKKVKLENGSIVILGDNEMLSDWRCPKCGGQVITNYGPGISVSMCQKCGDTDYDYD